MFNKPISEINYSDVESFCNTFAEGVRVEYKSEMIDKIPKAISAFANTFGGILLIGVTTDKVTNKVTSIHGIDFVEGVEEKIIKSCIDGIYPSIIPEVKILKIENKILVIIKVHESKEAPHAIENSTRVYMRTGNLSNPYELSEVEKIEHLLQRRTGAKNLKEELISKANDRLFQRFLKGAVVKVPQAQVSVSPLYPYKPLISLDKLYEFCRTGNGGFYDVTQQRIMDGVCKFYGNINDYSYREVNHYGMIFVSESLRLLPSQWRVVGTKEGEQPLYLYFPEIVKIVGDTLNLANTFYKHCKYFGNLEIRLNVNAISGQPLILNDNGFADVDNYRPIDDAAFSSYECVTESLDFQLVDIIESLMKNVLWVFNCPHDCRANLTKILKL